MKLQDRGTLLRQLCNAAAGNEKLHRRLLLFAEACIQKRAVKMTALRHKYAVFWRQMICSRCLSLLAQHPRDLIRIHISNSQPAP